MGGVAIGPFAFSAERIAAIVGIVFFVLVAGFLAGRSYRRLDRWSFWAVLVGLIAARIGYVLQHAASFLEEPLSVFAIWQGGFSPLAGALGVAAVSLVMLGRQPRLLGFAAIPLVTGLFAAHVTWQLSAPSNRLGLPEQAFPVLDAERVNLADVGQPMVVNLWATWCPPCRREMPMMADVAATSDGVRFVFANQAEGTETIRAYLAEEAINLDTVLLDPLGRLGEHYGAPGLPATLFIAADGSLVSTHLGEISRQKLTREMDHLEAAR